MYVCVCVWPFICVGHEVSVCVVLLDAVGHRIFERSELLEARLKGCERVCAHVDVSQFAGGKEGVGIGREEFRI